NATATTALYTLSLHDALPIYAPLHKGDLHARFWVPQEFEVLPCTLGQAHFYLYTGARENFLIFGAKKLIGAAFEAGCDCDLRWRSEEHTSELQSRSDLVCRLL